MQVDRTSGSTISTITEKIALISLFQERITGHLLTHILHSRWGKSKQYPTSRQYCLYNLGGRLKG